MGVGVWGVKLTIKLTKKYTFFYAFPWVRGNTAENSNRQMCHQNQPYQNWRSPLTMWSTTEMGSIEGTIYMRSRYKTGIYSRMSVRNAIQELYILHFIGKIQGCTRLKKYFCRYFPKHWLASASCYPAMQNIIDVDSRGPGFFHYPSLQD